MKIQYDAQRATHIAVDNNGVVQYQQRDDETFRQFQCRVFGEEA